MHTDLEPSKGTSLEQQEPWEQAAESSALAKAEGIRRGLIAALICLALLAAAVLAVYFGGYKRAKARFEAETAAYQAEVEALQTELEERIAVDDASTEVDLSVLNTQVQGIAELATVEYLYTDAGRFADAKQLLGMNVPFTQKSFVAKWDGVIKAGVDVDQIELELDEGEKTITVYLPPAKIQSHTIDPESVETLDESDGLFNKLSVEDVRTFDETSQKAMEKRAIENGLLEKAAKNAEAILERLICADPTVQKNYTVRFETKQAAE